MLAKHEVLYLRFNDRTGYDPDDVFLITQNDRVSIVAEIINELVYAAPALPVVLEDGTEEASDEIHFNIF